MPDGHSDLIFNFSEPLIRFRGTEDNLIRLKSAFFTGTLTTPLFSQGSGQIDLLGINFRPGGLRALFGIPLHLMSNRSVDLDSVLNRATRDWTQRLAEMKSSKEKIHFLNQILMKRLAPIDSSVKAAVRFVENANKLPTISAIEKEVGACGRNLERKFRDWVGVSPKLFSRIVRFQRALNLIETSQGLDLSTLAFEAGFYDQAHLNKDFREFTGKPPLSFIKSHQIEELSDSYNTESFAQVKTSHIDNLL
jgi:AraC-like DNA-binding protein